MNNVDVAYGRVSQDNFDTCLVTSTVFDFTSLRITGHRRLAAKKNRCYYKAECFSFGLVISKILK